LIDPSKTYNRVLGSETHADASKAGLVGAASFWVEQRFSAADKISPCHSERGFSPRGIVTIFMPPGAKAQFLSRQLMQR